jgi:actin
MTDYSVHIVLDNGESNVKAGFNGENAPRVAIPTVIGYSKNNLLNIIEDKDKYYIGNDALINSSCLNLNYPLKNAKLDSEKMEKVWSHIFFNELKVKPENHNVFITESLFNSAKERQEMAEIMFEKFSIFNIHIEPQPVMTLYSTTKTSGLIVESGEGMTQIVPIYEGYLIKNGIKANNLAGNLLTNYFMKKMESKLKPYNLSNPFLIAKRIKEKFSEVSVSADKNPNQSSVRNENPNSFFDLPDGNLIEVKNEKNEIPEILFDPSCFDLDLQPIQEMIYDSIQEVDINLRSGFLNNIVLGGGNTMIKNFPERLKNELNKIYKFPDERNIIKINAQNERLYSAWIGASVVCSISNFQQMWISKNDYEEEGANIINKKSII